MAAVRLFDGVECKGSDRVDLSGPKVASHLASQVAILAGAFEKFGEVQARKRAAEAVNPWRNDRVPTGPISPAQNIPATASCRTRSAMIAAS